MFRKTSRAFFQDWVAPKAQACAHRGGEGLLFVNAWNEWAEGNHLEPCLWDGDGRLDALRAGLEVGARAAGSC